MKTSILVAIILGVLLFGALGYIGFDFYKNSKDARELEIFNYGYQQAVLQIARQVKTCTTPATLQLENESFNVVALECYQQAPQGGQ